jgi:alkylation response protein AidB-like acyl-CoA dehydrogenase
VTVGGLDPSMGLVRVRGVVAPTAVAVRTDLVPDAVAVACRRALAYELLAASTAMLGTAADYAKVRTQFGQPIGAFQAVKHRLADVYVGVRAAAVVTDESWDSEPALLTLAAKSLAAGAFSLAAENCLQVLGAIGFTLEHDLHRYIRRGKVLDRLYGSERELRLELGAALRERGRMPRPSAP